MNQINFMIEFKVGLEDNIGRDSKLSDYWYLLECLDSIIQKMSNIMRDDPVYYDCLSHFQLLRMLEIRLREKIGHEPDIDELSEFTGIPKREILMFRMRFNFDMSFKCTLKYIASRFSLSQDRIRQINEKTKRSLISLWRSRGMQKWGYL